MTDNSFDLDGFIAFCRSRPADERYEGTIPNKCALAQFGIRNASAEDVPTGVYQAAVFHGFSDDRPAFFYTFGALADRLSKLREGE